MESRFKLTMRTWDDVWKSTAWAKFAPDKLKQTLQRSSRNRAELKAATAADVDDEESFVAAAASVTATAVAAPAAAAAVQVKKSRFRVVPHVQIDGGDKQPPAVTATEPATGTVKRSSPKPPLSSSSGSSDTDSDRLPAGLPMIESNLNELTMVESELKKLEREHEAKHQLLTPKNDGGPDAAEKTADDGGKQNHHLHHHHHQILQRDGADTDGKKDKATGQKVGSRAAETHSKRLGWLKAFRRKSSADTNSDTSGTPAKSANKHNRQQQQQHAAGGKSSSTGPGKTQSSSPRQQQKRASAAKTKQQHPQHHVRASASPGTSTNVAPVRPVNRAPELVVKLLP